MATKKTAEAETKTDEVTVETTEGEETSTSLPSVEDSSVNVTTNAEVYASADAGEPSKGWTVQSEDHYTEQDIHSEGAVATNALPTVEGLKEAGVRSNETYLSGVVVKESVEVSQETIRGVP